MLRRGQDGEKRGRGRAWAAGRQGTNASLPHLQTADVDEGDLMDEEFDSESDA